MAGVAGGDETVEWLPKALFRPRGLPTSAWANGPDRLQNFERYFAANASHSVLRTRATTVKPSAPPAATMAASPSAR